MGNWKTMTTMTSQIGGYPLFRVGRSISSWEVGSTESDIALPIDSAEIADDWLFRFSKSAEMLEVQSMENEVDMNSSRAEIASHLLFRGRRKLAMCYVRTNEKTERQQATNQIRRTPLFGVSRVRNES